MLLLRSRRPGAVLVPALRRCRRPGLAIICVLAATVLYWEITSFVAYTGDAYVTSDLVGVAPQVSGRIVAVYVHDNEVVRRGDKLVTIDKVPLELAVEVRRAALDEARAQTQADRDAVTAVQSAQDAALASLQFAQATQIRATSLTASGDESQQQLDAANDASRRAGAGAGAARSAVGRAREIVTVDEAVIARATAGLAEAEWRLSRTDLVAPADGRINHLTVQVGDTAREDTPLIGIVDAATWRVVANYRQDYLRGFRDGGTAWVWLDSAPWHWRRARIEGIAAGISRDPNPPGLLPYVAPTTDWIRLQRRFPVTLTLVGSPPDLRLFMGADARVLIFP